MPCLNLSTNVVLDEAKTSSLISELTSCVAKNIGTAEEYVKIVLNGSVTIAFGGTEHAAAYGELMSLTGGLTPDVNQNLTSGIAEILEAKLHIPKNRFFLKFFDSPGTFFGWNGNIMV